MVENLWACLLKTETSYSKQNYKKMPQLHNIESRIEICQIYARKVRSITAVDWAYVYLSVQFCSKGDAYYAFKILPVFNVLFG